MSERRPKRNPESGNRDFALDSRTKRVAAARKRRTASWVSMPATDHLTKPMSVAVSRTAVSMKNPFSSESLFESRKTMKIEPILHNIPRTLLASITGAPAALRAARMITQRKLE